MATCTLAGCSSTRGRPRQAAVAAACIAWLLVAAPAVAGDAAVPAPDPAMRVRITAPGLAAARVSGTMARTTA